MAEIAEAVKNTAADLEAEPVLRFAEFAASLLSWAIMSAARRGGYDGVYEYDNYTPLTFLMAMGILQLLFVVGVVAATRAQVLEAPLLDKVELFGSLGCCAAAPLGFVAGAAASTVLHDEFGGASICAPQGGGRNQKDKAAYFCGRVDASVAFAFFAAVAAVASTYLVLKQRGLHGGFRPESDPDDVAPNSYNPIGRQDGRTFEPFHGGPAMEGVGHTDVKHDAAVDL